jgi:formate/nitrite transporter FocA (FNT family)
MDYVAPPELIAEMLRAAKRKSQLSLGDMLLRGALAGAFLGFATSLVFVLQTQGLPPIAGALLFPVGFVIPAAMFLNAQVSVSTWWLWNQIPVTLGNILSGSLFTGLALYSTFGRRPAAAVESQPELVSATVR